MGYKILGGKLSIGGGGGFTDDASIRILLSDVNATQSDTSKFLLNMLAGDTNASHVEGLSLKIPSPGYADANIVPADSSVLSAIYTATGTFTAPKTGNITVQCFGSGEGGKVGTSTNGGNGGNGGSFVSKLIAVTANQSYTVTVGVQTAAGGIGNDSWFGTATTARAIGGSSASTNIGDTIFTGGLGAAGALLAAGGGGGGGAGTTQNGGNAAAATGGTGGVQGGGTGSTGQTGAGLAGVVIGGGGSGGGGSLTAPGAASTGARGEVRVLFTI